VLFAAAAAAVVLLAEMKSKYKSKPPNQNEK
jgi:hypothetical protein